jgi:tetratricopeptide (TPR) repeat protein
MQEAEGYLDLIRIASWPTKLDVHHRCCLAERAITALNQAAPVEDSRSAFLRGQAYRFMGKYRLAIVALRRAITANRRDIRVHLALAWCYKRVQRLDLAIETLEDALEIEGDSSRRRGMLHYNLACYWSLANNVGLTLAHLSRAFELNSAYRRRAQDEIDFDPVRHHPEFLALTGAVV